MDRTILVLYKDHHSADFATEALLDAGISHQSIITMSGNYWQQVVAHPEELKGYPVVTLEGDEILLKVDAAIDLAITAREIICNSGPLDVRERKMGEAIPIERFTVTHTPVQPIG